MASWFRKKRKAKAPEPIALVGLECGVDDAGDDEERVPSKTFSHRMGPDSPWEQFPAHQCLVIEEAMRARPSGGSVRLSEHLPFEIRWGTKATSSRLRCIPTTRMIQVNLRSTNTRVVRADPPPLPPKSSWTGGEPVDADPNWPTRRGNATRLLRNQWGSTRRRRRRHFVLGPIPGEDEQSRWTLRWYNREGDIQPCGAVSLRHGDVSIHNGGDRVIDVRVAGSATGGFQMVCDDAAARDGWWRALAACVAATRALARKRTIVSGYVVKDLDDGATLTEQFADAATTTVFGKPRTPDGRVLERALSERSSKSGKAYREVVKLIIRPPRAEYDVKKLGPTPFTYVRRFRGGKQTVMRSEFAVVNSAYVNLSRRVSSTPSTRCRVHPNHWLLCAQVVNNRQDVELKCSQWKPVGSSLADLPCVLYLHGNASCRLEALQVLKVVLELGCTLCCVDMAGSGLSEGEFVSLGHFEKFDAEAVLHELRSGGRSNGRVALWGRSMGAATALMCTAKLDPLVSCVIADSAFASLPMLVHDLLDEKVGSVLVDPVWKSTSVSGAILH
jgi:hypothetical protein